MERVRLSPALHLYPSHKRNAIRINTEVIESMGVKATPTHLCTGRKVSKLRIIGLSKNAMDTKDIQGFFLLL